MIFVDPSLLWLGGALTALVLIGVWSHGRRRRRLAQFLGGHRALVRVSRSDLSGMRVGRSLLLGVTGASLAVAAAEPTWIEPPTPEPPPIDRLLIAIDVSASMQGTDVQPTRLGRAVDIARGLLTDIRDQEVGLLVFAGTSYPIAPPTLDHDALEFMLDGIVPTMASAYDPGTLGSVALFEAMTLLDAPPDSAVRIGSRRIVVISDGDDGEPERTLAAAVDSVRALGVEVHAIGVGTERGSSMSLPSGTYQLGGPVTTASGGRAFSRLDEPALRALAERGGGSYAHADSDSDLTSLRAAISAPPPALELPGGDARPWWSRYDVPYVLGVTALVLLVLESLLDAALPRVPALRARRVA